MKSVEYIAEERVWFWRVRVTVGVDTHLTAWGYKHTKDAAERAADHYYSSLTSKAET